MRYTKRGWPTTVWYKLREWEEAGLMPICVCVCVLLCLDVKREREGVYKCSWELCVLIYIHVGKAVIRCVYTSLLAPDLPSAHTLVIRRRAQCVTSFTSISLFYTDAGWCTSSLYMQNNKRHRFETKPYALSLSHFSPSPPLLATSCHISARPFTLAPVAHFSLVKFCKIFFFYCTL